MSADGFMLVDWHSPTPVERFEAVKIAGEWVSTVLPAIPFTGRHLLESYRRCIADDEGDLNPDQWAYDVFSISDDSWFDAVVALLHNADPDSDFELLLRFGADIYANTEPYYDRMERELETGTINPRVLGIVLSMEKPEFMHDTLRARHHRLVARCK